MRRNRGSCVSVETFGSADERTVREEVTLTSRMVTDPYGVWFRNGIARSTNLRWSIRELTWKLRKAGRICVRCKA